MDQTTLSGNAGAQAPCLGDAHGSRVLAPGEKTWLVRPAQGSDRSFIFSSWIESYRYSPGSAGICDTIYFSGQRALVGRLLDRCHTTVLVSPCEPALRSKDSHSDPNLVCAWVCWETMDGVVQLRAEDTPVSKTVPVIHWISVKKSLQNLGLATQLLKEIGGAEGRACYTHRPTPIFRSGSVISRWKQAWLDRHDWLYDPYLLMR